MGSTLSRLRLAYQTLKFLSATYEGLLDRLSISPGIPASNPSTPYWTVPASLIAQHGAEPDLPLPDYADVVIIGSGITGTAIAKTLLDYDHEHGSEEQPLKVVILEARDACYGATARNGGHITPPLYHDYVDLKEKYGLETAQQIIRFRLAHLDALLSVAKEENLLQESQCREVQTFDVFFDEDLFKDSKERLAVYTSDMPEESKSYKVYEQHECQNLQLSSLAVGCLSTRAGAMHPYRLVTGILSHLIKKYIHNFHLSTHTPCTAISSSLECYTLTTPKGTLRTLRVIHATNAWSSHLLPEMRKKIIPARGNMSAQRPGRGLGKLPDSQKDVGSWTGMRSFVFYPTNSALSFDYLTQQPSSPASESVYSSAGEMMFGGGFMQGGLAEHAFFKEVGNADDRGWNLTVAGHLGGALGVYFGRAWGEEGRELDEGEGSDGTVQWDQGRVKAFWSGILGISADGLPWVGKLPERIAGRDTPSQGGRALQSKDNEEKSLAPNGEDSVHLVYRSTPRTGYDRRAAYGPLPLATSGEWISAGYSGEGMVHAWGCGIAVAHMILGLEGGFAAKQEVEKGACLPEAFGVTEKRWERAKIEDLFDDFGG